MQIDQLIKSITDMGFYKPYPVDLPGLFYYIDNMQGCWVDLKLEVVGANIIEDGEDYSTECKYDFTDKIDIQEAYDDVHDFYNQIKNPTVQQALDIQKQSREWYDILDQVAPGRFDIPSVL